jgi:DNA-directed RNA polymerase subunit M/transcription elongation factor TFIIS
MKKFCLVDGMRLRMTPSEKGGGDTDVLLKCPACGYKELMNPKTSMESLVLKTDFNSGSSASGAFSGVGVNDFTLADPTLPHVKNLRCPNESCETRVDSTKQDVIYIKTSPSSMDFLYVCTVCRTQWTS